jgi:hypothetical protein
MINDIRPSNEEIENSWLVYGKLVVPEGLSYPSPKWKQIVSSGNQFKAWHEDAVREAVRAYGVQPPEIQAEYVRRPPMASPLIAEFFVNLDPFTQSLIASAAWDGFKLGMRVLNHRIRELLNQHGIPDDAYWVGLSPAELEQRCLHHVRERFHPRAGLTVDRCVFNTKFEGGYAFPVDEDLPTGWEITVKKSNIDYVFVVDGRGKVFRLERVSGNRRERLAALDLLS